MTTTPHVDRPVVPDGYGLPSDLKGVLPWEGIEERLRESPVYWLATTRPDGRPHVVPRWGVWVDGRMWYDGAPTTRHALNLRGNPNCALHLEDGTKAVILEGTSGPAQPPGLELGGRLSAEYTRKYSHLGYKPQPDAWEGPEAGGLGVFTPTKGLAWAEFPKDMTRYRFDG
jgi:hypothetical protein